MGCWCGQYINYRPWLFLFVCWCPIALHFPKTMSLFQFLCHRALVQLLSHCQHIGLHKGQHNHSAYRKSQKKKTNKQNKSNKFNLNLKHFSASLWYRLFQSLYSGGKKFVSSCRSKTKIFLKIFRFLDQHYYLMKGHLSIWWTSVNINRPIHFSHSKITFSWLEFFLFNRIISCLQFWEHLRSTN